MPRGWWRIPSLIVILVLTPCVGFGQEPSRSFEQLKGRSSTPRRTGGYLSGR